MREELGEEVAESAWDSLVSAQTPDPYQIAHQTVMWSAIDALDKRRGRFDAQRKQGSGDFSASYTPGDSGAGPDQQPDVPPRPPVIRTMPRQEFEGMFSRYTPGGLSVTDSYGGQRFAPGGGDVAYGGEVDTASPDSDILRPAGSGASVVYDTSSHWPAAPRTPNPAIQRDDGNWTINFAEELNRVATGGGSPVTSPSGPSSASGQLLPALSPTTPTSWPDGYSGRSTSGNILLTQPVTYQPTRSPQEQSLRERLLRLELEPPPAPLDIDSTQVVIPETATETSAAGQQAPTPPGAPPSVAPPGGNTLGGHSPGSGAPSPGSHSPAPSATPTPSHLWTPTPCDEGPSPDGGPSPAGEPLPGPGPNYAVAPSVSYGAPSYSPAHTPGYVPTLGRFDPSATLSSDPSLAGTPTVALEPSLSPALEHSPTATPSPTPDPSPEPTPDPLPERRRQSPSPSPSPSPDPTPDPSPSRNQDIDTPPTVRSVTRTVEATEDGNAAEVEWAGRNLNILDLETGEFTVVPMGAEHLESLEVTRSTAASVPAQAFGAGALEVRPRNRQVTAESAARQRYANPDEFTPLGHDAHVVAANGDALAVRWIGDNHNSLNLETSEHRVVPLNNEHLQSLAITKTGQSQETGPKELESGALSVRRNGPGVRANYGKGGGPGDGLLRSRRRRGGGRKRKDTDENDREQEINLVITQGPKVKS